jgi:hypothetical protein
MNPAFLAIATLGTTLLVALLVDRGAPNILESIAFGLESAAGWTVTGLRRSAAALRSRQRSIEHAHQVRMAGVKTAKTCYNGVEVSAIDVAVSSGSSSAAA